MSNTFVTPKAVTTIAQSRIDYNQSVTSLLDNFASVGAPGPGAISLEGSTGLRTGMLWYKSGSSTADGQGRLFVYNGTEFTRNGINTYKVASVSAANAAVVAGTITYGELVTVGNDTLYIVNASNTGVVPLTVGTAANSNLLDGLDSTQFLRSDAADSMSGKLTVTNNVSVSQNLGIGVANPSTAIDIAKDVVTVTMNDTNGSIGGNMNSYLLLEGTGVTHGELGFVNTSDGELLFKNRQGNVTVAADTNNLKGSSSIKLTVDNTERLQVNSNGISVSGNISATGVINATQLNSQAPSYYLDWTNTTNKPDPTLTINGDASGLATFTDLGNATLTLTIADDSHNHTIANVDGLQSALDLKLNSSSYTAADVLTKIKTVDGASSGLDADLLDGQNGSYYLDWTNTTNKPDPVVTVSLSGDVSGSGQTTLTDLANGTISITTSVQPNSVALGTDTTGNYVSTISGTTNQVSVSGSGSESAAVTLSLPQNIHTGASPSFAGLTVSGTATAADFNSTSDRALKRDFSKIDSALSKVQKISGYTFTYKATDKRSVGVIAQEIEQILPEAVSGEEGTKTVAYGNLVALLIEAVKEQQQQIERLQNGR